MKDILLCKENLEECIRELETRNQQYNGDETLNWNFDNNPSFGTTHHTQIEYEKIFNRNVFLVHQPVGMINEFRIENNEIRNVSQQYAVCTHRGSLDSILEEMDNVIKNDESFGDTQILLFSIDTFIVSEPTVMTNEQLYNVRYSTIKSQQLKKKLKAIINKRRCEIATFFLDKNRGMTFQEYTLTKKEEMFGNL